MPRHGKGPRLYLRGARRDEDNRLSHKPHWVIRDGLREVSTRCSIGDREAAERFFADYLANKYQPSRKRGRDPSVISVADVLNIYLDEKASDHARPKETAQRVVALLNFFGGVMLEDVNESSCRRYTASRSTEAAARRELEDLQSAINYHYKQGLCTDRLPVWLPEAPPPRTRWLTRSEAASLLWAMWRARNPLTGRPTRRHAARFLLVGLYTGTRAGAICAAAVRPTTGCGHVDLEAGVFYRKPIRARRKKNKPQPPVRMPDRLLAHTRRWVRCGIARSFLVEWNDKPVKSVRTAWNSARAETGLDEDVVRHALRHTAATWLMQGRTDPWEAAGYLGMSVETMLKHYGHHHPDYQRNAAANISAPPQLRPNLPRTDQERAGAKRKANG
jgi:integrase